MKYFYTCNDFKWSPMNIQVVGFLIDSCIISVA